MLPDKLVYMANQIGKFFAHRGEDDAAEDIADHIMKFWTPGMRRAAVGHLEAGGKGFDPVVARAISIVKLA